MFFAAFSTAHIKPCKHKTYIGIVANTYKLIFINCAMTYFHILNIYYCNKVIDNCILRVLIVIFQNLIFNPPVRFKIKHIVI